MHENRAEIRRVQGVRPIFDIMTIAEGRHSLCTGRIPLTAVTVACKCRKRRTEEGGTIPSFQHPVTCDFTCDALHDYPLEPLPKGAISSDQYLYDRSNCARGNSHNLVPG